MDLRKIRVSVENQTLLALAFDVTLIDEPHDGGARVLLRILPGKPPETTEPPEKDSSA